MNDASTTPATEPAQQTPPPRDFGFVGSWDWPLKTSAKFRLYGLAAMAFRDKFPGKMPVFQTQAAGERMLGQLWREHQRAAKHAELRKAEREESQATTC